MACCTSRGLPRKMLGPKIDPALFLRCVSPPRRMQPKSSHADRNRLFEIVRDGGYAEARKALSEATMSWTYGSTAKLSFFHCGAMKKRKLCCRAICPRLRTAGEAMRRNRSQPGGSRCTWADGPLLGCSPRQHGGRRLPASAWLRNQPSRLRKQNDSVLRKSRFSGVVSADYLIG